MAELSSFLIDAFPEAAVLARRWRVERANAMARHYLPSLQEGEPLRLHTAADVAGKLKFAVLRNGKIPYARDAMRNAVNRKSPADCRISKASDRIAPAYKANVFQPERTTVFQANHAISVARDAEAVSTDRDAAAGLRDAQNVSAKVN